MSKQIKSQVIQRYSDHLARVLRGKNSFLLWKESRVHPSSVPVRGGKLPPCAGRVRAGSECGTFCLWGQSFLCRADRLSVCMDKVFVGEYLR